MNVLIVSPCVNLPVPAVQGGAVSTLIEYLVKENEVEKKMNLTVLSIANEDAQKKAKEYSDTKFEFIHPVKILDQCDHIVDTILTFGRKSEKAHQYFRKQYSLRYISRYMKQHDFDKVIFQNSGYLLNVLKDDSLAEKYKGKLYYHLHNDIPNNISVKAVCQCKLLLISEYLKKHINEVCQRDISEQCRIVKNGFDCDRFAQQLSESERRELKKELCIDQNKKIVMFAGRITAAKGIVELTQAIELLNRDDVVLLVVGAHNFGTGQSSSFQKEMEQRFASLGEKVRFTGYIPYDEIWKYYQLADIAALPSVWEEPAGLTMIEACAAGVPLITTDSGGIPEYILRDEAIILERTNLEQSLSSAIEEVINHYDDWKKKSLRQCRYVQEHYNVRNYYKAFLEAINE